jgi:membrane-associated protein
MHYGQFSRFNVIGALLWVPIFSYLGYYFANLPLVRDNLSLVLFAIIILSVMPGVIEIIRHRRAAKKAQ